MIAFSSGILALVLALLLPHVADGQSCGGVNVYNCSFMVGPPPTNFTLPPQCPGCGPSLPRIPVPVCAPPTGAQVSNLASFYPYCGAMLSQMAANGETVWFPSDTSDPLWATVFKPQLVQYLSAAAQITRPLGFGQVPLASVACADAFIRLTCMTAFPTCFVLGALPSAPSTDVCTQLDTVPNCRALIYGIATQGNASAAQIAVISPDCTACESGCVADGSNPLKYGNPRFPTSPAVQVWYIPPSTTPVPVPASSFPISLFDQSSTWPCYTPWANCPAGSTCYCNLQCPSAFRTPTEYNNCAIMVGIVGWFSYISTFFVFVTMALLPRYRHFPANLVLMVLFCSHIAAFGFVFVITRGWQRTVCVNSVTPASFSTGACVFDGLVALFGALATTFFWAAIAVNSFIAIYLKQDSILRSRWFEIGTHVVCWGFPVTSCIIALAVQSLGAPLELIFCFVADNPDPTVPFSWQYPLFFAPVGLCILVATGAIIMVLWEMRNLRASEGSSRFAKHLRIAAFLVTFLGIFCFIFAFRFSNTTGIPGWAVAYTAWATANIYAPVVAEPYASPSYGLFMAFHFFVGVQGVLIALLFGSASDILEFWVERFRLVQDGRSFFSGITSYKSSASSVRSVGKASDSQASGSHGSQ